jgi:thiosulfate/3-mercaptopyruvate sulfurtransferase
MLRWVGHAKAAVLDGGWEAWTGADNPVTATLPTFTPASYNPHLTPQLTVDAKLVLKNIGGNNIRMLDARSPDRFRGENETLDPVAGHIPGAANRFFKQNLDADGRFKPADVLKQEFAPLLNTHAPNSIVHQCGSGVTACHNLLAMEVAGLAGSRLYPGSWSEWVSDRARPVEK